MGKDIFISYKNDGSGNHFANRLCQDLESIGYSVYFNPNEERAVSFPERLKTAVSNCKDFILVLSAGCLEQLKENKKTDWVREEILTAREQKKHIIPILLENVKHSFYLHSFLFGFRSSSSEPDSYRLTLGLC